MNRLKKIFSFVLCLSFALLLNVSYASFTTDTPISWGTNWSVGNANNGSSQLGNYTLSQVKSTVNAWKNNPNDETYYQAFLTMAENLKSSGFSIIVTEGTFNSVDYYYFTVIDNNVDVACDDGWILFTSVDGSDGGYVYFSSPFSNVHYKNMASYNQACRINGFPATPIIYSNTSIKHVIWTSGLIWDSTYYYEVPTEPEEEKPVPPSNSEIAQAVQNFYNSDYYKNNKDFKDFIVLYNYKTKYFDFIGHNYNEKFQQLIFPAGHKYNQQWWKFSLDGLTTELLANITNKYYWLYSTNDFGENIKYEGKGAISDLLDLHFSTSSIIVYSTNEYDVVVYTYDENDEFVSSEMETMLGDQYTYNENLDPTTNEYNPIRDFIPTDPSQNILGDVNFDEINKVFEENKDILNIKNASWLFTANNQLVNYFTGFLSFLIVLIIISRLLGG